MASYSDNNEADIIQAFVSLSRYLNEILNIDTLYLEGMVGQIYTPDLLLNKTNASDIEASNLYLHLSISKEIASSKIYDECDVFDFDIVFDFLFGRGRSSFYVLRDSHFLLTSFNLFDLLECLVM